MKFLTKKRVVLFLLFIFPLICFLILSTGENNFKKLPILKENISNTEALSLDNKVSVICFLGNNVKTLESSIFNLNEKIYKKFLDYNDFQIIAVYPSKNENEVKDQRDLRSWHFVWSKFYYYKKNYNFLFAIIFFLPILLRTGLKIFYYLIKKDEINFFKYKNRWEGMMTSIKGVKSFKRPKY